MWVIEDRATRWEVGFLGFGEVAVMVHSAPLGLSVARMASDQESVGKKQPPNPAPQMRLRGSQKAEGGKWVPMG